ncbi:MAG: nuclear transport factor 2 family protein [Gemmiger sp.]|nr:nuclear transport factor 2 family protein [Gemmiger sp.]
MQQKEMITEYFNCWLKKDATRLPDIFSTNAVYSECYGPEYFGLNQITRWFEEWNQRGTVLQWDIKQIIEQDNICIVAWYFACAYQQVNSGFDGVSIIIFDKEHKIISVKEFGSKAEHNYPYGRV